jgi:hypothetical protein
VGGTTATQSQKKVVAEGWGGADGGLMPVVAVTLDAEVRVWRVGGDSSLTTVEGGTGGGRQGGETVVMPPRPRAVLEGRKRSAAQRSLVSSCE